MKCKPMKPGAGIALGVGIGVAIGVATGQLGAWIAIGAAIGYALASSQQCESPASTDTKPLSPTDSK